MKKILISALLAAFSLSAFAADDYVPCAKNLSSRKDFAERRFGIFLHWGLYAMYAQGEWYMQNVPISHEEYSKAAGGFYPSKFDARQWVRDIKASGAGYITITSRHHEGFSLWGTKYSPYNVVDATPFGRDILKELSEACQEEGIRLHFYYSHLDWGREDYPMGRTGKGCKDASKADWPSYYKFMNNQLIELLSNYGPIGAIWFDGWWDHDSDPTPFDWQLSQQYALIHSIQPGCLVGNNHHGSPLPGEDIQIFERDLPGENTTGWVQDGMEVSTRLPLETCETMNGMWGYRIADQNYKSVRQLVHLLVRTAGKGANLLMNIGPQPDGQLPATAVERLHGMGNWMDSHAETIRGTVAGEVPVQQWGATTRRGNRLFVHILDLDRQELYLPVTAKVVRAFHYDSKTPVRVTKTPEGIVLTLPEIPQPKGAKDAAIDYIVEIETK